MIFRKKKTNYKNREIDPDEIMLDSYNLPGFNSQQFEGRVESPIKKNTISFLSFFGMFVLIVFLFRLFQIQVLKGNYFEALADQNSLEHIPVFSDRGIIYDRNNIELSWNREISEDGYPRRAFVETPGFANLIGYVSYPGKDKSGRFYQYYIEGKDGIEKEYNDILKGRNGVKLIETDVYGKIIAENVLEGKQGGKNLNLTIDYEVQKRLYDGIQSLAQSSGYKGGAGAIMDINTGELLALTSYPEYNPEILSEGENKQKISEFLTSSSKPFLNRVIDGLYTPGSIVKPFLALGALQEGIITPEKIIVSTGELVIPNPYNPELNSVFKDNKAHGPVNIKKAIAVSSNVYFYEIGGGYKNQEGLGISRIEKYLRMFGIGEISGIDLADEKEGNIPSVEWKAKRFPGDLWRVGDTYNTSIGQYGFQVTPIQMLRAVAGVASKGKLVTPRVVKEEGLTIGEGLPIKGEAFNVVQEAMRMCVTEGTCQALNLSNIEVAAKTGTAQISNNTRVNSWVIGFFPYKQPQYAFAVLMENGPLISSGASHAIKPLLEWISSGESNVLTLTN